MHSVKYTLGILFKTYLESLVRCICFSGLCLVTFSFYI